jgi:hypothetical protein
MPSEHLPLEQRKKRPRRDWGALLEGLETRTLLSAGPHDAQRALEVRVDSTPGVSAFVVRATDEVAPTSGDVVSSKPADMPPTDTKSVTVDWTRAEGASSFGPWSHPDGQPMNFMPTQANSQAYSSMGDGVYANATSGGGKSWGAEFITVRADFRRADEDSAMPTPPPIPPAVVVAAAANTTPAVSVNQTQTNPIAPHAAVTLPRAEQSGFARPSAAGGGTNVALAVINAPTPVIASISTERNVSHDPPDLSWSDAIFGINTELTAFREILQRPGVFATAGQSVDFMEKLLISDAAALAQVANGVAMRLNEENALLWKGAAGLLGVAMIVAAGAGRERPASQLPKRQRRNPKHLCIGERRAVASDF